MDITHEEFLRICGSLDRLACCGTTTIMRRVVLSVLCFYAIISAGPFAFAYISNEQHFKVLPKNQALSQTLIEYRYEDFLADPPQAETNFSDLKNEAYACWAYADPKYRFYSTFQLRGQKIVMVGDFLSERNDICLYYFNAVGEYLNSLCGGSDRRWAWND